MKVCIFTTRLIQLNNYLPYFPPDGEGQMVTALPDDKVKEILYHTMPNLWRKEPTKQVYNYADRSIQEMSGFFKIRVENLETSAPLPAVRSLTRKNKNKNFKKRKAVSFEDSDEVSSDNNKPPSKKKFCQYHGKSIYFTDGCNTLKTLIKKSESG